MKNFKERIIDMLKDSYAKRLKTKEDFDNTVNLSSLIDINKTKMVRLRLLDEGAIVQNYDVNAYIMKGALKKFYDNLSDDDFRQYNENHIIKESNELRLGLWSKKNLELVQNEDGRYSLFTNVELNNTELSTSIIEYLENGYTTLSAGFYFGVDSGHTMILEIPVLNDIDITEISIVKVGGNVKSNEKIVQLSYNLKKIEDGEATEEDFKEDNLKTKIEDLKKELGFEEEGEKNISENKVENNEGVIDKELIDKELIDKELIDKELIDKLQQELSKEKEEKEALLQKITSLETKITDKEAEYDELSAEVDKIKLNFKSLVVDNSKVDDIKNKMELNSNHKEKGIVFSFRNN